MNKSSVQSLFNSLGKWTKDHSPELLIGLGIASGVTTVVLAVKATPKAIKLIEEEKKEKRVDKLAPVDTVKATWKCYIPAALTGTASIACVIGANSVNARRHAALAAAYELSTTALKEYRSKVVETIGEKKEKVVREKIAQDHVDRHPVKDSEIIIINNGETLFYESISGRYFKSDLQKVRAAINDLNEDLTNSNENYISLSELYGELGLDRTSISDKLGWRIDRGKIEVDYPATKAPDGTPCLSIEYINLPEPGFDDVYGDFTRGY